jgi:hypothetical protein
MESEAEKLGGQAPEDWEDERDQHYSDKGGHKERSLANQPSHKRHWQKIQRDKERESAPHG